MYAGPDVGLRNASTRECQAGPVIGGAATNFPLRAVTDGKTPNPNFELTKLFPSRIADEHQQLFLLFTAQHARTHFTMNFPSGAPSAGAGGAPPQPGSPQDPNVKAVRFFSLFPLAPHVHYMHTLETDS